MSKRVDLVAEARKLDRFDFILTYVAWYTRTKAGREVSGGMQAKRVRGGWAVGMPSVGDGAWTHYAGAREAFEHLRRTAAGSYTQDAEAMRVWVLS